MKGKFFFGVVAIALLLAEIPAVAHHSIAAEFDRNKSVKVRGIVTSMMWSNPHAWLYLDVKDADGKVSNWGFEMNGLNVLYRQGWRKGDLPIGTEVIVEGFLSKTSPHVGNSQSITSPDGRPLFSGPPPAKPETER